MFNCVIFFSTVARFLRGRVVIVPKYSNPAKYFAPVSSQEYHASDCLDVSFSSSVYFYVAGIYWGNYFAVPQYLCIMLCWGHMQPALWFEGFLIFNWRPRVGFMLIFSSWSVLSLTYSPYPFSLYLSRSTLSCCQLPQFDVHLLCGSGCSSTHSWMGSLFRIIIHTSSLSQ